MKRKNLNEEKIQDKYHIPKNVARKLIGSRDNQRHQVRYNTSVYLKTWTGIVYKYVIDQEFPSWARYLTSFFI